MTIDIRVMDFLEFFPLMSNYLPYVNSFKEIYSEWGLRTDPYEKKNHGAPHYATMIPSCPKVQFSIKVLRLMDPNENIEAYYKLLVGDNILKRIYSKWDFCVDPYEKNI